jgi:hypothetical protein
MSRFVLTDSLDEVLAQLERCPSKPHGWKDGRVRARQWELNSTRENATDGPGQDASAPTPL